MRCPAIGRKHVKVNSGRPLDKRIGQKWTVHNEQTECSRIASHAQLGYHRSQMDDVKIIPEEVKLHWRNLKNLPSWL